MDETILTWNVTNWITVVLMAVLGYFLIVGVSKGYQQWQIKQGG